MKKRLFIFLFLINFIFLLASCNTSRPSAYLSSMDNKKGVIDGTIFVSFETFGGTKIERKEIKKGTLLEVPSSPIKDNAEFNGWYTDQELTIPFDFGKIIEESITLYAKWSEYNKIIFETNGGKEIEPQYVKDGYNVKYVESKKDYADFNGWYIDADFTIPFDFSSTVFDDITLYARWNNYHKIIFQTVGGIIISIQYVKDNFNATEITPVKRYLTFDGWYLDKEYKNRFDFSNTITEDIILYARWS